jgi:phosphonate transport system substrate-binding protein
MTLPSAVRLSGVGLLAAAALVLSGCGSRHETPAGGPAEITFSILSAQGQASAGPLWQPLLDDLAGAVDVPVKPHFAGTYATLIEDMKRGETQVAWFSAQPAVEAIDTAGAELIARTVSQEGADSYRSTLIVRRGSGITLGDVLACGKRFSFGIGDAQSTSGRLAPATFLFTPRSIQPAECFATTRAGNHETNAFQVASGVLDARRPDRGDLALAAAAGGRHPRARRSRPGGEGEDPQLLPDLWPGRRGRG